MSTTTAGNQLKTVISSRELLDHWQGHRALTRKVIEAFPEKEYFEYSIGGMRPFAAIVQELLAIAAPGIRQIVKGTKEELNEEVSGAGSREKVMELWDRATSEINELWPEITDERFHETIMAFGMYEGTIISTILYYIDNEIHHRGQGYVYLRSLGIEPPAFWNR